MSDDVLAVKITPDGRLIALALLDSTVQVVTCATVSRGPQLREGKSTKHL